MKTEITNVEGSATPERNFIPITEVHVYDETDPMKFIKVQVDGHHFFDSRALHGIDFAEYVREIFTKYF